MSKRRYHRDGAVPQLRTTVFVFGSNLKGIHGAGAALAARLSFGALHGQGFGRQGQSYAIPTKYSPSQTLPLYMIREYIRYFLKYAEYSDEQFWITRIGCGLAGYEDSEIAPLWHEASPNLIFPRPWEKFLE